MGNMLNAGVLKTLVYGLKDYYQNAEETEKIIVNCALVAAGADAVAGLIPILNIPAAIVSCFGAVWVMYGQLCDTLGISLKKNVLKLLARAALANILANLGGAIAVLIAGMFVPGASVLASAVITFVTVYLAGVVFLRLILNLAKTSKDPFTFSDISVKEMKRVVKAVEVGKKDLEEAKRSFESNKKE